MANIQQIAKKVWQSFIIDMCLLEVIPLDSLAKNLNIA